ncbi:MAG: hypothetical protein ACR2H3_16515 [Acidimicrobiales bacterium]
MQRRLVVLAGGPSGLAAADLDSPALIRVVPSAGLPAGLRPWDVVAATVNPDDRFAFAADTISVGPMERIGRLRGRRLEKVLRPLVHPEAKPLLGGPADAVAYWTLNLDEPSLALIEPAAGPVLERASLATLRCRFRWRRLDHDLLLDDPMAAERIDHPSATRLAGRTLARALGWAPHRLLVALTPPVDGMCAKVVAGLLPRP